MYKTVLQRSILHVNSTLHITLFYITAAANCTPVSKQTENASTPPTTISHKGAAAPKEPIYNAPNQKEIKEHKEKEKEKEIKKEDEDKECDSEYGTSDKENYELDYDDRLDLERRELKKNPLKKYTEKVKETVTEPFKKKTAELYKLKHEQIQIDNQLRDIDQKMTQNSSPKQIREMVKERNRLEKEREKVVEQRKKEEKKLEEYANKKEQKKMKKSQ
ncbi:hypothetical protein [Cardinium endosymbiont of Nabis limbatus]|uniref:hypothetical protein n=1 Tax=Cardinium endosymbiont of Nabis limbatus TaxID=3066217 RepID=UPI003AF39432